jgi:hypothetical protein
MMNKGAMDTAVSTLEWLNIHGRQPERECGVIEFRAGLRSKAQV